jgi:predicted secreted Zn-dependent protease
MFQLTFEMLHPFYGVISKFRSQKRSLWLALAASAVFISLLSVAASKQQVPHLPAPTAKVASSTPVDTATIAPAVTPTPKPPASAVASNTVTAPQECIPAAYGLPTRINLLGQPSGLTQVVDATTHYQVFGYTSAQIKTQLRQCAPTINATDNASFAAETGSSLVWQYDTSNTLGVCTISNVKVGLHLNMILPQWQPTESAESGLAGSWQSLMSGLTTHENGHVAIYQQYAQQLLSDLQSLPATDCAALVANVATKSATDVAALNAANQVYDEHTNHGVNQGAVLR